jgi:hypothetical protein
MAGEVRIQTVVQLIKFGGYRQFSVPKPPLLLAAKRCGYSNDAIGRTYEFMCYEMVTNC